MAVLRRLSKLDHQAFDAVAAARLPGLEYVLPRLSRAANHSLLWFGAAGALAMTGQPRLRRAALRGAVAIGVASPVVNVIGKQAFRRRRPRIELVGPRSKHHGAGQVVRPGRVARVVRLPGQATQISALRVRWRLPTSPSFPSGHTASAAAFATAVAMEAPPRVTVPVAVAALGVAFARVYTGAHYPGDVLAGAALGSAAGLATRLVWPMRPGPARALREMPAEAVPGTSDAGAGLIVVVNPGAGGSTDFTRTLRDALPEAEVIEPDDNMDKALDDAASRAVVLGVCGGDGTVNAAAKVALDRGLPLLVVPGGTLNHFSRALGMETVAEAVAAYRSGSVVRVDVAQAGDEIFLNTASFGIYTELVDLRERLEGRLGKWPAMGVAAVRVLRRSEPVEVLVDGERRRIWVAFVGNCRYASRGVAPTWRDDLDDGVLDVRMIGARRHISKTRALAALLVGHLRVMPEYAAWRPAELRLDGTDGTGGPLRLARDGETGSAGDSVTITKRRAALAVFRPA